MPAHLAALLLGLSAPAAPAPQDPQSELFAFVDQHCAGCHEQPDPEGGLDLVSIAAQPASAHPEEWSWVLARLKDGTMPPAKRPRPDAETLEHIFSLLEPYSAAPEEDIQPRGPRRLNRRELRNAVRDLLLIELDESALPSEAKLHAYDVVATAGTLGDTWLDRWLDLALEAAAEAVALPEPESKRHEVLATNFNRVPSGRLSSRGTAGCEHRFVSDGTYRLGGDAWADQAGPDLARVALVVDGQRVAEFDLEGEGEVSRQQVSAEAFVSRGVHEIGVEFINDFYDPEAEDPGERDRNVTIEGISIEGPLGARGKTDLQLELAERFGHGGTEAELDAMLTHLARRGWRREIEPSEIERLRSLAGEGASFEARLRLGVAAILSSPHFLFVLEPGEPGAPLDGYELAARLALGLWGSLPDHDLLDAAAEGELDRSGGLKRALDRLLASERSDGLFEGFVPQWLQLQRLETHRPDPERYPDYNAALAAAMFAEPIDFFAALARDERPLSELLTADWTVIEDTLAAHYGLPEAPGQPSETDEPRGAAGPIRRSLAETPRRGLLGQAGPLTAASDPGRTSPVLRGKWVLEALLGAPPPPPPPGVLTLDETAPFDPDLSIRDRLEVHRSNPSCASCHASLDPLGFALERFDAIGRERTGEVDDVGELPDGTQLDGALGLAEQLRTDPRFLRQLTRSLSTWLVARPVSESELDLILGHLDEGQPSLRELLRAIIVSDTFRRRPG